MGYCYHKKMDTKCHRGQLTHKGKRRVNNEGILAGLLELLGENLRFGLQMRSYGCSETDIMTCRLYVYAL